MHQVKKLMEFVRKTKMDAYSNYIIDKSRVQEMFNRTVLGAIFLILSLIARAL